uniref:Uncharacterized protein n=1 Tax=Medicago truncatula TaxID=3880 RepID=A2Q2C1_MEDTR|nr:hypothetical protein MtrDRAFT_AC149801g22v2 [Medicago truncatula]
MSENICFNNNDDEIQVLPHLAAKTNFFGLRELRLVEVKHPGSA